MRDAAQQEGGGGGLTGAGLGLGAGASMGAMMGQMMGQAMQPGQPQQPAAAAPQEDPKAKLKQLKEMLDDGLITKEEYEKKKQDILSRM
jgi:membrane protease subunit (stomatin/prohibitin family)